MNVPNAQRLLQLWEEHHSAHPIRRALAVLEACWPEVGALVWAQAPIGLRDGCLFEVYQTLFGSRLSTTASCPRCNERLEADFDIRDIRTCTPALPTPGATLTLQAQGHCIEYRLPSSADLLPLATAPAQGGDATAQLLQRCVVSARCGADPIDAADIPAALAQRLSDAMAEQDPDADVRIALSCPACAHRWRLAFDIVGYLWDELEDWAQHILSQVHELACAYGWSERDILGMSATRRQIYLDMARA